MMPGVVSLHYPEIPETRSGLFAAAREMKGMQAAISPDLVSSQRCRGDLRGDCFKSLKRGFDSEDGNAAGVSGSWGICLIAAASALLHRHRRDMAGGGRGDCEATAAVSKRDVPGIHSIA